MERFDVRQWMFESGYLLEGHPHFHLHYADDSMSLLQFINKTRPDEVVVLVEVSADFYRSTDVVNLWGDPTKAKNIGVESSESDF